MAKMKNYKIVTPGNFYALDFEATSKKDAIAQYKDWDKIDRMPRGYSIWQSDNQQFQSSLPEGRRYLDL